MKQKDQSFRDAAARALYYGCIIRFDENEQLHETITSDIGFAKDVREIIDVVAEVVRTRATLFGKPAVRNNGIRYVPMTELGKKFVRVLKLSYRSIQQTFSLHEFHPLFDLYWRHVEDFPFLDPTIFSQDAALLNQIVHDMRAEARLPEFRAKRDRHVRWSRDATGNLLNYIDELFAENSRQLVVRLDVGYRQEFSPSVMGVLPALRHQKVNAHRVELLRYLRSQYGVKLNGYAWALGYGRSKGFHYHLLLFFNASEAQSGYLIGEELGKLWRDQITKQTGTYHNCNAARYARHGIGMVHVADAEAIRALKVDAASYLTKPDYYVRCVINGGHTFDRGNTPIRPQRKRGRPRTRGCAQATVLQSR